MKKLLIIALLFPFLVFASALDEHFDSYTVGDLNGQGSWSGDTEFDVQSGTVQADTRAVQIAGNLTGDKSIDKSFTQTGDDSQIWYSRLNNTAGTNFTRFFEDATEVIRVRFHSDASIYYHDGTSYVAILGGYSANQWYKIEVEWRSVDSNTRYTVNANPPSAWDTGVNSFTVGLNKLQMLANLNLDAGEIAYWDSFGDAPAVEDEGWENYNVY